MGGQFFSDYAALDILKKACPTVQIHSRIIVGFHGEKEKEFQGSLKIINKGFFDFVEVYAFSILQLQALLTCCQQILCRIVAAGW